MLEFFKSLATGKKSQTFYCQTDCFVWFYVISTNKIIFFLNFYLCLDHICCADELAGERDKFRMVAAELDSTFTELTGFWWKCW
jgi:hypothetical protein